MEFVLVVKEVILWIVLLMAVWAVLGFGIVHENERVVKILLGRPYAVVESGWFWIPFGIAWVRRYTTKVVELVIARRDVERKIVKDEQGRALPAGGFITATGEVTAGIKKITAGPVNIGVTLSFRFNWPADYKELLQCVKLLPSPEKIEDLTDIFHEIILDEARGVGSKMTYIEILSERKQFAQKIRDAVVKGDASELLIKTGLKHSTQVVIDHIDVPKETLDAIDDEEAKRLQAEGVRREAEGKRDKQKLEGEGFAAAYKAIKAEGPEAMQLESLRTLREMAQGTSNTIFFPLEAIQKLFGNFLKK